MEPRLIVACTLIALLGLAATGVILRLRYTARDATLARRRRRARDVYRQRRAEREQGEG